MGHLILHGIGLENLTGALLFVLLNIFRDLLRQTPGLAVVRVARLDLVVKLNVITDRDLVQHKPLQDLLVLLTIDALELGLEKLQCGLKDIRTHCCMQLRLLGRGREKLHLLGTLSVLAAGSTQQLCVLDACSSRRAVHSTVTLLGDLVEDHSRLGVHICEPATCWMSMRKLPASNLATKLSGTQLRGDHLETLFESAVRGRGSDQ